MPDSLHGRSGWIRHLLGLCWNGQQGLLFGVSSKRADDRVGKVLWSRQTEGGGTASGRWTPPKRLTGPDESVSSLAVAATSSRIWITGETSLKLFTLTSTDGKTFQRPPSLMLPSGLTPQAPELVLLDDQAYLVTYTFNIIEKRWGLFFIPWSEKQAKWMMDQRRLISADIPDLKEMRVLVYPDRLLVLLGDAFLGINAITVERRGRKLTGRVAR